MRQVNTELIENVVGQVIAYYAISLEHTNFHPVYGEAIEKTFLPPVRVYARVETQESIVTNDNKGYDKRPQIYYDNDYYEIVSTKGAKRLFGQAGQKYEMTAQCIKAREGVFDGN